MQNHAAMKKLIYISIIATILFASCSPKPLYNWGNYEWAVYKYTKSPNEKTTEKLIKEYEKIIANPKGRLKRPAPGIYADYGFLLIKSGRVKEGKKMLEAEIALYPESSIFIGAILKRFENEK